MLMNILLNSTFWPWLQKIDKSLLVFINRNMEHPFLNALMPWVRESIVWSPLYLFFIVFALSNFGAKKGMGWMLGLLTTVGISDQISSNLLKNTVQRLRPCTDPNVFPDIILRLERCSGGFSFTSSHATNHFAVATFMVVTLQPLLGLKIRGLFIWALVICFAQVYVGVHYPLDVLGGSLIGLLIGWLATLIFKHFFPQNSQLQP